MCGSFGDIEFGDGPFDRLYAAQVAAMARPAELSAAARGLVAGGTLLLAFASPADERTAEIVEIATTDLRGAGFAPPRRSEVRVDNGLPVVLSAVKP